MMEQKKERLIPPKVTLPALLPSICRAPLVPSFPHHLLALCLTTSLSLAAEKAVELSPSRVPAHITTAIRTSLPGYTPPAPTVPAPPAADDASGIVLLDPITVSDDRPLTATPWEMLTDKGRAEYLKKKYPGATPPGDATSERVPNYGLLMFRDDKRLTDLKGMNDLVETARLTGDRAGEKKLKKEIQRVLIRQPDWQTESMDKSYNSYRN